MKKIISLLICISILAISSSQETRGQTQKLQVRIKDIVSLDGIYEAKLLGMGIVTGLNNTGDKQNNEVTQRFLENMMREMGISIVLSRYEAKNMAVVTVTATLPPKNRFSTGTTRRSSRPSRPAAGLVPVHPVPR